MNKDLTFYAKDLNEPKCQFLIQNCEDVRIKHLNDPKEFIIYSNTIDGGYNKIDYYNPNRKRKILIVFDDIIANIMTNKEFKAIIK